MSHINAYAALAEMLRGEQKGSGAAIAVGEIISVTPLRVRVGELTYEASELRLCEHIELPDVPGGKLLLVSLDGAQSYYAIGRC